MIGSIGSTVGGFRPPSPAEISNKMFSKIDGNSDGSIVKDELEKLLTGSSGDTSNVEDIMQLFDTDQDGNITKTEFEDAMEQIDPHKKDRVDTQNSEQDSAMKALMDALDSSAASEFKQQLFDKADANSDGTISDSEFETFIDELKKHGGQQKPEGPPPTLEQTDSSLFELAQQSYSDSSSFGSQDYVKTLLSGLSWSA
jgi:Ca2+-binding EF-hand superfamily protein